MYKTWKHWKRLRKEKKGENERQKGEGEVVNKSKITHKENHAKRPNTKPHLTHTTKIHNKNDHFLKIIGALLMLLHRYLI